MSKYQIKVTKPDNPKIYTWINILDNKERTINEYIRLNPNYITNSKENSKENNKENNKENIEGNFKENNKLINENVKYKNLLNLNSDVLTNIEKNLNLSELSKFRQTCNTIYNTTSIFNKIDLNIFNIKQKQAIKTIVLKIIREDTNYLSFTGSAGSGKSFTIIEMFKKFKNLFINKTIGFIGPTNIIVNKFKENHNNIKDYFKNIKYLTVSGLLAEKPQFDSNGNKIFKAKYRKIDGLSIKNKKMKNWQKCFDILIFDESSMIESEKIKKILDIIKTKKLNIVTIFVGDKNQLNPINENENFILESPTINLEKNMRCSIDSLNNIYNYIIDEISLYNDNYDSKNLDVFITNIKQKLFNNKNNIKVYTDKKEFLEDFINIYKKENSIITTYTNKECEYLNTTIKNNIVQKENLTLVDKYYVGQQIIFMEPYLCKKGTLGNSSIIYNTSELAQITNINKKHIYLNKITLEDFILLLGKENERVKMYHILTNNFNKLEFNLNKIIKIFNETLKYKGLIITINNNKNDIQNIEVLNSKDENKLEECVKNIENEINILKNKYKKEVKNNITDFDDVQKLKLLNENIINTLYELLSNWLSKFAKINDGYALTVHKSQGITINNIYVNLVDILSMTDTKNKLKCIYTAFTRCSDNLVVYLLDNPICNCYKYTTKFTVNNGPNKDKTYWKCEKCKYFKWNDNLINNNVKII